MKNPRNKKRPAAKLPKLNPPTYRTNFLLEVYGTGKSAFTAPDVWYPQGQYQHEQDAIEAFNWCKDHDPERVFKLTEVFTVTTERMIHTPTKAKRPRKRTRKASGKLKPV